MKDKNKKPDKSRYLDSLKNNRNNIIAEFDNDFEIKKVLENIRDNDTRLGYFVVNNFKVADEIAFRLNIDNELVLMVSKNKLYKIMTIHKLDVSVIQRAIKKAALSPEAIVYDSIRKSFQFYVKLDERGYRTIIVFDTVPQGITDVKANVLTSLFEEKRFRNRIESIKKGNINYVTLIFDASEGWTALVTHSHLGAFYMVAATTQGTPPASKKIINKQKK